MSEIYVINPEENIPEVTPDILSDVERNITPASEETLSDTDICSANSSGLTSHMLLTAQSGVTLTGGFLTCFSSGIKFSDNSVQTTAALGSDYFDWTRKTSSFTAEAKKKYVISGNNSSPTTLQLTLPTGYEGASIQLACLVSGFVLKKSGSDTIETSSSDHQIISSTTGQTSNYTVIPDRKVIVLIFNSGDWKIYN